MIRIGNLSVSYNTAEGPVHAVRGIDVEVARGQFYTLLGPSGCGKTTTLRCLAGLERPTAGTIAIDGETVFSSDSGTMIPTYKRDIGMVFQSYAIWPASQRSLRTWPSRCGKCAVGYRAKRSGTRSATH